MNKQSSHSLGFCDWSWNPVRGLCPESPEYARLIYARFHYDPQIRLDEKALMAPYNLKKPVRIFCGSTIDMFHQDINGSWLRQIVKVIEDNPQHTFIFLYHFSPHRGVFPYNCWLGLTVTSYRDANKAVKFSNTYPDHIKFILFEPLLEDPSIPNEVFEKINWVILGAERGNRKGKLPPRTQWIEKLLDTADKYRLPVYMKDSLDEYRRPLKLRQEFPKTK